MQPTARAVIDPILTSISTMYKNSLYIADMIAPLVRVEDQSAKYHTFPKGEWFRDEAQKRAPGGASEGSGFPLSSDNYNCEERAHHTLLEDEVRDNQRRIRMERAKTEFVTEKVLISLERDVASLYTTAANWANSTTLSGTDQWSDYDNSDPVANLETGMDAVHDSTGKLVTTVVLGRAVWKKLKHHPQLLDRMPVTGIRTATLSLLAQILSADMERPIKILVGSALHNNAKRGANDSFASIWGKHVWLGHVAPNPAQETPSAAYTFWWPRDGQMRGIRRWRDEDHHSDKIEAFMSWDAKAVGTDLGYVIRDAVA